MGFARNAEEDLAGFFVPVHLGDDAKFFCPHPVTFGTLLFFGHATVSRISSLVLAYSAHA